MQTAIPVAEKLDPVGAFMPYKLFRDATRFHNGKVVKDLSYLNRDLSKVVMLETDVEHGALQPENTVGMKMWDGKAGDRGLVDMIPFLECECCSSIGPSPLAGRTVCHENPKGRIRLLAVSAATRNMRIGD